MEYLLLCPHVGRPSGTGTIPAVHCEASIIGNMLCAMLVPSSRWDGSLESPLPVFSYSNSKSDPIGDEKEKLCPALDSAMLVVPLDTLRTLALLQRIIKPTHWPNRSLTIFLVYTDSSRTCTTWTATSNGYNFTAFSSILHLMLSWRIPVPTILFPSPRSSSVPVPHTLVLLWIDSLTFWNSLIRLPRTIHSLTLLHALVATIAVTTRLPNVLPSILDMTAAVQGFYTYMTI